MKEFLNLHSSIPVEGVKQRQVSLAICSDRVKKKRIFIGSLCGKQPLGWPRQRRQDIIKMDLSHILLLLKLNLEVLISTWLVGIILA
jgi:hypothetical protein